MRCYTYLICVIVIGFLGFSVGRADVAPAVDPALSDAERQAAEIAKAQAQAGALGPVSVLLAGGPDAYGYTWIDSDELGGPTYAWVDTTPVGTAVPFPPYVDDGNVGPIPIGFGFPFYGNTFDQLYVCSNGWLSFTNSTLRTYTNQPLPNSGSSVPENLLAPWWDDMVYDESDLNEAYYYNDGSRFIVEFYIRRIAAFTPPFYRFQVILYPDGRMMFQYHTLGTRLNSCTIGIQNATKDDGLTVVYNDGAYPHEELAILFTPPLQIVPAALDIKPGSCPNPLNTNTQGKGRLPMAILGTENFDVNDIHPASIKIAEVVLPKKPPSIEDVSTPVEEDECTCQEVDPDGFADLVIHFSRQEIILALGLDEMAPGTEVPITVTGELLDGTPFEATDCVILVGRED
ncbi:MAG: hypothetical protein ACYTEL_26130 [Planctomycetota bacterium]|jgi:hypothetical protein